MESLTPVVNYILEGEFPKEFTPGQRRKLIKQASTFLWLEGALYQKGKDLVCRRVPSTNEIPKILKGLHEEACGGHFSHELTLKKVLLAGYVWLSMHADVQHWCRSCHNCQVNGNKSLLYGPRQAVIANGPFEKWGIDAMGPLPRTVNGKLYILVAIDYMTRFGTPLEIVSDNGPRFRRGLLTEVCIIRKMVESKPKRWDNFLDGAIWAYRTTYRDATQFTPFHLVYGQEALQPIELNIPTIKLTGRQEQNNDEAWIDRLLSLVELEWKREAAYHCYEKKALQLKDKLNEGLKDKEIKEKSLVLRYNNALDNRFDAKFERRWEGPFIVKKAFTGGYYQLMDLNGKEHPRKVNGYRLKPYLSRILPAVFESKQVSKKTKKVNERHIEVGGELANGSRVIAKGLLENAVLPDGASDGGEQHRVGLVVSGVVDVGGEIFLEGCVGVGVDSGAPRILVVVTELNEDVVAGGEVLGLDLLPEAIVDVGLGAAASGCQIEHYDAGALAVDVVAQVSGPAGLRVEGGRIGVVGGSGVADHDEVKAETALD
ncbi:hypothetical protein L7F22_014385 [Adiantum nelumboides]|nr:hypothetical protein [Adiantum nelumboides]